MRSKKLFMIIIFFTLTIVSFPQQSIVEYKDMLTDPFLNYSQPIGVAIFPFTYNGIPTNVDSIFYKELTIALGKEEKFLIYFHKNLEALKKKWGIKEWDATNAKVQKQLNNVNELDVKLIIYAVLNDSTGNSFTVKIIDTNDGHELISEEYEPSMYSNALTDAVKLITENKKSKYEELGKLIVTTKPGNEFNVYINSDSIGITPCEKYLKEGNYELVIYKYDYQIFRDSIGIEQGKELSIEQTMVHLPIIGSLHVSASPNDVKIELYKENVLINKGVGSLSLDTISTGEYKILAHLQNYVPESKIIYIQRDRETGLNLTLKKELLIINNIVTDNSFVKNLKIEKSDKYYTIFYNLMDEADEEYEVKLFLVDKSNEEFSVELKRLNGDIGEGEFYGTGKTIRWNWADEFKGGIANDNLYLRLTVEKLGGGIAWYYFVGAAVLGGTAAIIIKNKTNQSGGPTNVAFPLPPNRPTN